MFIIPDEFIASNFQATIVPMIFFHLYQEKKGHCHCQYQFNLFWINQI